MAYCVEVTLPGGARAIVRMSGRGPKPCSVCQKAAGTQLCDFKQPGSHKSCDKPLCTACAVQRFGADFCPGHPLPPERG